MRVSLRFRFALLQKCSGFHILKINLIHEFHVTFVVLRTETHLSNEKSWGFMGEGKWSTSQYSQLYGAMQLLHGCRCLATIASALLKATHGYASKHVANNLSFFSLSLFFLSFLSVVS